MSTSNAPNMAKTVKVLGPDHPITIERSPSRIVVTVAGHTIADTRSALTLREAHYPPVFYIPRKDVDMTLLERTEHSTYCPYKGDAAYFSIPSGGERAVNAIWTYESPYSAVEPIRDHLAFYPERQRASRGGLLITESAHPSYDSRVLHREQGARCAHRP